MNWLLYAILGAVLAGLSPVLAKSGMHKSNSHLAAALRGTFLFLSAWYMVNLTGTNLPLSTLGQNTFLYLIFSGIATGLVWICLLRGLQLGEVIKVVPIVEGSVILNILVGIFLFHDGLNWNKIIILVLLTIGTIMMGLKGSGRGGKSGAWLGYALGAMALTTVTVMLERIGYSGLNSYYERLVRYGIALIIVWTITFATKGYKGLRSLSAYMTNQTKEDFQKERDELLSASEETIRGLAKYVEAFLEDDCICVVGAAAKVKESKELFGSVENLL